MCRQSCPFTTRSSTAPWTLQGVFCRKSTGCILGSRGYSRDRTGVHFTDLPTTKRRCFSNTRIPVALGWPEITWLCTTHVDNEFLKREAGINHTKVERVVACAPHGMSRLGFTHAVFDGRLPGFERVVREYINHLWWLLIEGNGVSQPAARNKVQRRRGDGFHRGGSGIEEIHFIFEAGRRLWGQKAGGKVGEGFSLWPGLSLVVLFFPAAPWPGPPFALLALPLSSPNTLSP